MELIPDHRAEKPKQVSDHSRDHDENDSSHRIESFDEVNGLNYVSLENEVDAWLGPAD